MYSYHAANEDELTLTEGQVLNVLDQNLEDAGWWKGELSGKVGVFPDNFVELLPEVEEPGHVTPPLAVSTAILSSHPPYYLLA